jgi:hypothetical protein
LMTINNLRFRWLWMELNSQRERRSFCRMTFCHLWKLPFTVLDAKLIVQKDERQ